MSLYRKGNHTASGLAVIAVVAGATLLSSGCSGDSTPEAAAATSTTQAGDAMEPVDDFVLDGTWSGRRERISNTDGYRAGNATLTITDTQGLTFTARMSWSSSNGVETDRLVGAMTSGGAMFAGADYEGTYSFSAVDADTLDYCYTESDEGYRTSCGRLKRS